jgi:hypothetical protein
MWPYIQMWFPLLTIALTAAICVSSYHSLWGMQRVPGKLLMPKTATAEYFSKWRSSASVALAAIARLPSLTQSATSSWPRRSNSIRNSRSSQRYLAYVNRGAL